MSRRASIFLLLAAAIAAPGAVRSAPAAAASDAGAYYRLPLLQVVKHPPRWEDSIPGPGGSERLPALSPRVVIEGGGEGYLTFPESRDWAPRGQVYPRSGAELLIRVDAPREIHGRVFLAKPDASGMTAHPFTIPADAALADVRPAFLRARLDHLERRLERGGAGAAWFRHRIRVTRAALGEEGAAGEEGAETGRAPWPRRREHGIEDTFAMVTGGRALSENLSLDHVLAWSGAGAPTVPVDSIPGIAVEPIDWSGLLPKEPPPLDPLAALVPFDQHGIFFPRFSDMIRVMDEADANGTPIVEWLEPRSVDAGTKARYERQLLLGTSALARLIGPAVVRSVAITGSDLYLRTGTDLAVLFLAKDADALGSLLLANRKTNLAAAKVAGVEEKTLAVDGVSVHALTRPDRSVCSYQARVGDDTVVVTNSLAQLDRIILTSREKVKSLASMDEFQYFRSCYPLGDEGETAFLVISDATLRRWCGPRWRIAASRRTRAAAVLADLAARRIAAGPKAEPGELAGPYASAGLGELSLVDGHFASSVYGGLDFLTPIREMEFGKVTEAEASGYATWKRGYESNWRQYYDPIAARIGIRDGDVDLDLSVMPLQAQSDYRQLVDLAGGVRLAPTDGDPHPEAVLHFLLALDRNRAPMRELASQTSPLGGKGFGLLDWIGGAVSIYLDEDPVLGELAKAPDPEKFLEERGYELPVALWIKVRNPFGLAAFLTSARAFIQTSAPRTLSFEIVEYGGRSYIKVGIAPEAENVEAGMRKFHLYYAVLPGNLTISLSEAVLRRAIDRVNAAKSPKEEAAAAAPPATPPAPWLGRSFAMRLDRSALAVLETLTGDRVRGRMQRRAWDNLPILNELHRRFPGRDPVAVYEEFFRERPVSPGGGSYVWNGELETMESTVYGCPAAPRAGPAFPEVVERILSAAFGCTFENGGLRARAHVLRR